MASQRQNADRPKEGAPTPRTTQPKQEHSEASQVLEIMRKVTRD